MAPRSSSRKRTKEEEEEEDEWYPRDKDARVTKKRIIKSSATGTHPRNTKPVKKQAVSSSNSGSDSSPEAKKQWAELPVQFIDDSDEKSTISPKKTRLPMQGFPRFSDGDVYIELQYMSKVYSYQLHRGLLALNSPWFKEAFSKTWDDLDNEVARGFKRETNIDFRFELFMDVNSGLEMLHRTDITVFDDEDNIRDIFPRSEFPNLVNSSHAADPGQFVECPEDTVQASSGIALRDDSKLSASAPAIGIPYLGSVIIKTNSANSESAVLKPKQYLSIENSPQQLELQTDDNVSVVVLDHDDTSAAEGTDPKNAEQGVRMKTEATQNVVIASAVLKTDDGQVHVKTESVAAESGVRNALYSTAETKVKIEERSATIFRTENLAATAFVTEATDSDIAVPKVENSPVYPKINIKHRQSLVLDTYNIQTDNHATILKTGNAPVHFKTDNKNGEKDNPKTEYTAHQQLYLGIEREGRVQIALPRQEVLDAYNNLFLIYYSKAPIIDETNIDIALEQLELLAALAEIYWSASIVVPHIEAILFRFQGAVLDAIISDPPRWMMLSMKIKSKVIYREAMIHVAGNYPIWPCSTMSPSDLPPHIVQFIELSYSQTAILKSEIDQKLFCNTITRLDDDCEVTMKENGATTTWFTIQLWRNWFTERVIHYSKIKEKHRKNEDGVLYRLIARGGDEYLPLTAVIAALAKLRIEKGNSGDVDVDEVSNDLATLKKQAQDIVAPLCVNRSRLPIKEAGITYLTCHEVYDYFLPWINLPDEFGH